jgi:DNA-binding CsgD family transcriptional regulator
LRTVSKTAAELYVSVKTVRYHLTRIYAKLRVTSRSGLAAIYVAANGTGPAERTAQGRPQ